MSDEPYQPVKRVVSWDAANIEIRLLTAVDELLAVAREQGLTVAGLQRVTEYLNSAAYDQSDLASLQQQKIT